MTAEATPTIAPQLLQSVTDGVLTLPLNRPEVLRERKPGSGRDAELTMLGETVDAARALELGIVNRVVPDSELASTAAELASRLARGPRSIGLTKRALNVSHENDLEAQLAVEERLQTEATTTSDFVEGVSAFLEK